jgi:hypothetical protein
MGNTYMNSLCVRLIPEVMIQNKHALANTSLPLFDGLHTNDTAGEWLNVIHPILYELE